MPANEAPEATTIDEALQAAARGWSAIPIEPRSKRALSTWKENQTMRATNGELEAAYRANPDAGVGFVAGEISGLVVLDIDPDSGGKQSMNEFVAQFGRLPQTPVVQTGGGGYHYYFKYPEAGLCNSAGKLGDGLDIRGDGGYVVAPPSIHPNGTQYRWAKGRSPDDIPLAPLPTWVIARLSSTSTIQQPITEDAIPEGKRHATLLSLGGAMVSKGMSVEAIEAALLAENEKWCEPPLAPLPTWVIARLSSTSTIQQPITEDAIPEGKRHATLLSLGGAMVSKGMSVEAIEAALLAENEKWCEPPLPSDEVVELANDLAARYEPASPAEAAGVLNFVEPREWLDQPEEPIEWVVEDIIPVASLTMLSSPPKAGKSTFARAMIMAVAKGTPFLGKEVQQGSVLLLAIEEPERNVKTAYRKLGITEDTPLRIHFGRVSPGHVPSSGVRVRHPVDRGLCHCLR